MEPTQATITEPGIYYMLPKTELLTVLSITRTKKRPARLSEDAWTSCLASCMNEDATAACKQYTNAVSTSYDIATARIYSRLHADPQHLYRVSVDFGTFSAFNQSFKLSDQGVLTYTSAELESKATEVAISTTKAIAKIAVTARATLAPPTVQTLTCSAFGKLYDLQMELERRIDQVERELEQELLSRPTLSAPAVEELKQRTEAKIKAVRADPKYQKLLADRKAIRETEALGDYAAAIEPSASANSTTTWAAIQEYDLEGYTGLQAVPANLDEKVNVLERLSAEKFRVTIRPAIIFGTDCDMETCTDMKAADYGFRYRVPTSARVQILRGDDAQPVVIGSGRALVAQYGALVSLPSKIKGLKSKVVLDMYEGTGAPKQVDVGATPQASTLVGDVLSPVQEELERRSKAKADEKAAAEGAEIADLTKERDLLKLKKEIQDLEDALEASDAQ